MNNVADFFKFCFARGGKGAACAYRPLSRLSRHFFKRDREGAENQPYFACDRDAVVGLGELGGEKEGN